MLELLHDKFTEDADLRAFIASLEMRDDLPLRSASISLNTLRDEACALLVRHGKLDDAISALERRGLFTADERRAWDLAPLDA